MTKNYIEPVLYSASRSTFPNFQQFIRTLFFLKDVEQIETQYVLMAEADFFDLATTKTDYTCYSELKCNFASGKGAVFPQTIAQRLGRYGITIGCYNKAKLRGKIIWKGILEESNERFNQMQSSILIGADDL